MTIDSNPNPKGVLPAPTAKRPRSRRRFWLLVLLVLGLVLVFPIAGLTSYLRISSDARSMRDSLFQTAPAQWHKTIELSAGALTLNLARAVLDRANLGLEPEVRAALQAIRSAEVGIYERADQHSPLNSSSLLAGADEAMVSRGWERLVGIVQRHQMVVIYTPKEARSAQHVKVCLLVVNDRQAVVVSTQGNLEPLVNIALNHREWPRRPSAPSSPALKASLASKPGEI